MAAVNSDSQDYNSNGNSDSQNVDLLKISLDFCRQFKEKSTFFFKISIDNFELTMKHGLDKKNFSEKSTKKKKYVSPSTRRRNNLRLLAFKARRTAKGGCSPKQPVDPSPPP